MKKYNLFLIAIIALCAGSLSAKPKYISPNNDGVQDEIVIPVSISDKRFIQGWSLVIQDENHNTVRTIENKVVNAYRDFITFTYFFSFI